MSLEIAARSEVSPAPRGGKKYLGWLIFVILVAALGTGIWYYFFGSKPGVVLSLKLHTSDVDFREQRAWPVGEGRVLVLSGDELKLCDLKKAREAWSAVVPPQPDVDPKWRAGVNARFVRLQQWAAALAEKRTTLSGEKATKAFNDEAAKYQAELAAARSEAAKVPPKKPRQAWTAKVDEPEDTAAEEGPAEVNKLIAQAGGGAVLPKPPGAPLHPLLADRTNSAPPSQLKAVVSPEVRMLEERMKKRAVQLADLQRMAEARMKAAKTAMAREDAKSFEGKYARLKAEQDADETALAKATGAPAPVAAATPGAAKGPEPIKAAVMAVPAPKVLPAAEKTFEVDDYDFRGKPEACVMGETIWLVDGMHAVAFGLGDGLVKSDVPLAGNAVRVVAQDGVLFIVASAGSQARQLTRIDATGTPLSMYVAAPKRGLDDPRSAEGGAESSLLQHRVEFTGSGGSLARADIRLTQRKTKVQDLIKPGAEKALTDAAEGAAAHSTDELLAISNLMKADAARLNGETTKEVDASTYEVTVSRPFEPAVAPLMEKLEGGVQFFSTPSLDLITAGTKLVALDRTNKKLWEATLGAPVPLHREMEEGMDGGPAMLETGGKLYFADGAFLSAVQVATGQVLWRMPNVGIRKVEADADGNLYVQSANLSVDALNYAVTDRVDPALASILKVEGATGKVLWDEKKYQDVWASGSDLYAFREVTNPNDATERVFNARNVPEARIKIYKLSRGSGKVIWEWYQEHRPLNVVAFHKHVAMLFASELQVIHSIAW